MKHLKKTHVTVFAVLVIIFGSRWLILPIMMLMIPDFRMFFLEFLKVSAVWFYFRNGIYALLGVCLIISGIALIKRKLWGRKLFLFSICGDAMVSMYILLRNIPYIEDFTIIDVVLDITYLIFVTVAFWFFTRKKMVRYLVEKEIGNL